MAGFVDGLLKIIGIEGVDDEEGNSILSDDDDYREEDVPERAPSAKTRRQPVPGTNVVALPSATKMKVIIYHPICYEDTQSIIDNLKGRKPVIVNMEDLDISCAQRIVDFMAGAVYALDGEIRKISRGIFVVVPTTYDLIGDGNEDEDAAY